MSGSQKFFCYEQTEPLGVPLYTFGFRFPILKHFFLPPGNNSYQHIKGTLHGVPYFLVAQF